MVFSIFREWLGSGVDWYKMILHMYSAYMHKGLGRGKKSEFSHPLKNFQRFFPPHSATYLCMYGTQFFFSEFCHAPFVGVKNLVPLKICKVKWCDKSFFVVWDFLALKRALIEMNWVAKCTFYCCVASNCVLFSLEQLNKYFFSK